MGCKHLFHLREAQRKKHCLIGIKGASWEGGISLELPVYPGGGNVSKPLSQAGSRDDSIGPSVPQGTAAPVVGWVLATLPP